MSWSEILVLVVTFCALFAVAYILVKRGVITSADLTTVSDAIESLEPLAAEGTLFDKILKYAQIAFHAAEQACHNGEITAEEKNEKAVEILPKLAAVDGLVLTDADMEAAQLILEANCDIKGHTETEE